MSTIEERLARDIAAVTGGVVVTESEMKDAREVLEHNVEHDRRQRSRRRTAAVVAAAVVVPLAGVAVVRSLDSDRSAPPVAPVTPVTPVETVSADPDPWLTGRAPTPELVQGVWREDNGTVSVSLSPSGAFSSDNNGRLFGAPGFTGSYEIAGDLITVHVAGGTAGCAGDTFAMRASITEPGLMRFSPTRPGSGTCSFVSDRWGAWERLAPAGDTMAGITVANQGWHPVTDPGDLDGLWMAEGAGYVLELDRTGAYYVSNGTDDPIDQGAWTMRGIKLILTSSADSASCSKGDQLVWRGVEMVDDHPNLRAWMAKNPCGVPWASRAWIWVPDVRR